MNDLAEKALEGLDVAHRQVRDHPLLSLGGSGLVVAALVVVAGGRADAARSDRPPSSWLGLLDVRSAAIGSGPGAIMLGGVLTLAVLWIVTLWVVSAQHPFLTRVWWVAGAWATPFVIGPPIMDTSVYTYVAYGRLQRAGQDPYTRSPSALGDSSIVAAIDPSRRDLVSSSGPLGSLLQHLSVSVGNGGLLVAVIVWRAFGVAAAVWIAQSSAELAGTRAAGAVAASALNPLVLLFVVSAAHLDAVMIALVLAALVAARRRLWWRALVLSALAGAVLAPGLLAVPVIAAVHWFGRRRRSLTRVVAWDVGIVALTLAAATLVQPDGLGWVRAVRSQFRAQHTSYSIPGATEKLLSVMVRAPSYDDLVAGGRLTAAIAATCTLGYLVVTSRLRSVDLGVGYALLAAALLAPVLNPWYLLWGVLVLFPRATGRLRVCLVALSVAGCVLAPPGFTGTRADVVTGVCLAVIAVVTAAALWATRPRDVDTPAAAADAQALG